MRVRPCSRVKGRVKPDWAILSALTVVEAQNLRMRMELRVHVRRVISYQLLSYH